MFNWSHFCAQGLHGMAPSILCLGKFYYAGCWCMGDCAERLNWCCTNGGSLSHGLTQGFFLTRNIYLAQNWELMVRNVLNIWLWQCFSVSTHVFSPLRKLVIIRVKISDILDPNWRLFRPSDTWITKHIWFSAIPPPFSTHPFFPTVPTGNARNHSDRHYPLWNLLRGSGREEQGHISLQRGHVYSQPAPQASLLLFRLPDVPGEGRRL